MIKISDRLMEMAMLVGYLETVADIGTDHGFLPIYLNQIKERKKIILADISEKSLDKARNNIYFYMENRNDIFDFRVGDGLKIIDENEVDAVVIGGMGGILIANILSENFKIASKVKRFVFQPRNACAKLRWWLENSGFKITSEKVVMEKKVPCEIILAEKDYSSNVEVPANLDNYESLEEKDKLKYNLKEEMLYENGKAGYNLAILKLYKEVLIYKNLKKAKEVNIKKQELQEYKIIYYKNMIKTFLENKKIK